MDQTDKMPVREVIRRIVTPMLVILVCLGGAWVFYITATIPTPSSPDPVPLTVRVQQVEPESVALKVLSQGTVIPSVETALIPEVSGKVIEISESLVAGGFFNSGDVLLRLDEADLKSATRQYEASLTKASAEFEHASFEHNRWKKLREDGLISDSAFNEVLRRFRIAESAVTTASEQLEQAKRDLTRTVIRAPFTGSVRSKQVDLGQFISRGVQIAVLYATEAVEVRLAISDARLAFLDIPLTTRGHIAGDVQPDVLLWADYGAKKPAGKERSFDRKQKSIRRVARCSWLHRSTMQVKSCHFRSASLCAHRFQAVSLTTCTKSLAARCATTTMWPSSMTRTEFACAASRRSALLTSMYSFKKD